MGNFHLGLSLINKFYNRLATPDIIKKTASTINDCARNHLSKTQNKTVQKGLLETFNFYSLNKTKKSNLRLTQIDDILYKYESCSDNRIKSSVESLIKRLGKENSKKKGETLDLIEGILDSLNCSEAQYCPLYNIDSISGVSAKDKLITIVKKAILFVIKNDNAIKKLPLKDVGKSEPQKFLILAKKMKKPVNTFLENFQAFAKYSPLEGFINKYKETYTNAVDYLYEKVYVQKQTNLDLQDFCRRIDNKFKVKTFDYTLYDYNLISAYKIEKELDMFYDTMQPELSLLKISDLDYQYIKKKPVGGYYNRKNKTISLPTWLKNRTFRHELVHSVDEDIYKISTKNKLADDILEQDLKNAGATEKKIKYATSKLCEKKAVLGEFYNKNYSQESKDFMVTNGLPKEIFNLREIDFYDYIMNARHITKPEVQLLNEIRAKMGGIIPQEIAEFYDFKSFKSVLDLIKNKKSITKENFIEILGSINDINNKKREILKLEAEFKNLKSLGLCPSENEKQRLVDVKNNLAFAYEMLSKLT
ncbi:hypothetical protein IJ384_00780 [bacterium]|nr:hypothetical protein [bacterium]